MSQQQQQHPHQRQPQQQPHGGQHPTPPGAGAGAVGAGGPELDPRWGLQVEFSWILPVLNQRGERLVSKFAFSMRTSSLRR
jgi:hypothetical protein